jgi:hypothetical protein
LDENAMMMPISEVDPCDFYGKILYRSRLNEVRRKIPFDPDFLENIMINGSKFYLEGGGFRRIPECARGVLHPKFLFPLFVTPIPLQFSQGGEKT